MVIALIPDDSVVSGQQKHLAEQQIVRTEDPSHVGVHPRLRSRIGIRLGPKVENFHVPARIRNRHLDQLVVGIDLEVHEQRFDASDAGLDRRCRALDVDRAVDLDDKSDVVDRTARIDVLSNPHLTLSGRRRERCVQIGTARYRRVSYLRVVRHQESDHRRSCSSNDEHPRKFRVGYPGT